MVVRAFICMKQGGHRIAARRHVGMTVLTNLARNILRSERGNVLIAVMIVATVFALLAYFTLQTSLHSLDTSETHAGMFQARLVAEGGIESAAARLRQGDLGSDLEDMPMHIPEEYAQSISETELRSDLIDATFTTERQLGFSPDPIIYERTAWQFSSDVSVYSSETDILPGDRDEALYRYHDDYEFSEDYPAYEFAPVQSSGDLVVYGVGEVIPPEGDQTIFSFLRAEYPTQEWTYDVRETGITEPSRIGPYPYIETEHPYPANQDRTWVVTYQNDPAHGNRNITYMSLLANPDEVQIDAGDTLAISPWNETAGLFDPSIEVLGPYTNGANEQFTLEYETNSIGLFFFSDPVASSAAGSEFGFRVSGVRYAFDSDEMISAYETPHPYDDIIPMSMPDVVNIQTVYSPYQALPLTAEYVTQQMRIQFDDNFSLDPGDFLFLLNVSAENAIAPIDWYDAFNPPPPGGWSITIGRDPDPFTLNTPLGIMLLLFRASGIDSDGNPDYGYKVIGMEYTDQDGNWISRSESELQMESPHRGSLGPNNEIFNFPGVIPIPPMPGPNYPGFQYIYRPFCPNTEVLSGVGTIDDWFVSIATAKVTMNSDDYIRLHTPGNFITAGYDTVHFAHPDGNHSFLVSAPNNWYSIEELYEGADFFCGIAPYMELEFVSDTGDEYEPYNDENFGYRIAGIGYTTSDGHDDDWTPPTIRTDINYPKNESYPSYGSSFMSWGEWWYANTNNAPDPDPLLIGLHFDRDQFNLDPGDIIQVFDESGLLIAAITSASYGDSPQAGGPQNPNVPGGDEQGGQDPVVGGPWLPGSGPGPVIDLAETYGWVLIPGTAAQVILLGDGDDNEGYAGFEIDHCGYINGEITEIRSYIEEYTELAYDIYYDRTSEALQAFRTLGTN